MASSGIGGQAVMEGVMMRNKEKYAVAVRKPDKTIIVETKEYRGILKGTAIGKLPIIRGVVSFVDSLILGMRTLTFSASFFEEDRDATDKPVSEKKEKVAMGFTVAISILFAIGLFMVLPYLISFLFQRFITSEIMIIIIEGFLRLFIFILYIVLISRMEDIKRVFMYHGAEHKCINCIEQGLELNLENVRKSSKQHKRCGTSFLFFVIIVSIIATMFIRADSGMMRLVYRLAILPIVAGISYEIIRLAGSSDNVLVNLLSKPGMWLQQLTTKEPDDSMIEVGMASVEAVFDWRLFINNKTAIQKSEKS
jgi:uncharacterized protein YqhQ